MAFLYKALSQYEITKFLRGFIKDQLSMKPLNAVLWAQIYKMELALTGHAGINENKKCYCFDSMV